MHVVPSKHVLAVNEKLLDYDLGYDLGWTLAIWGDTKGRVRSSPSVREVIDVYPTDNDGTGAGTLCATVF